MDAKIAELNARIAEESRFVDRVREEMGKVIVGQKYLIDRLLIALLSDGHILLEGVPGLAKTLSISTLATIIDVDFHRIQFTPDLLPADILGTMIFNQKEGNFATQRGPIFSNLILADEINRAPAKVQSALLEAMQERHVTLGGETFNLPDPFMVLATQNPIEQQGTYPLPEAQVDRFIIKAVVNYPTPEEELNIMDLHSQSKQPVAQKVVSPEEIVRARAVVRDVYVDEKIKKYVLDLVFATRFPERYGMEDMKNLIAYGCSPRASLFLKIAAQANAFLSHRGYVTPEDVRKVLMDVFRHRVIPTFEAEAEEMTSEDIIQKIIGQVEVP